MKSHPEDIIWNTITAHARTKFDYAAFKKEFGPFNNDRVLDTVLFQILEGCAENKSAAEMARHLSHDLHMLGYSFADRNLQSFVTDHATLFSTEIQATAQALRLFTEKNDIPHILSETEKILAS